MIKPNKNISEPLKASVWYTVCSIIQKGVSFVLVPIYVRQMTTEQYGTYTLFRSWTGIVLIFATLNLAAYAFNNCLIQNEEKKDYVTSVFLGLISVLTIIICIVFSLFREWWEHVFGLTGKYIIAMALDSFFSVVIDLWYARQRFDYNYKAVVGVTLFITFTNMAIGILCVKWANDKAFAAIIVKLFIQGLVNLILALSIWNRGRTLFDKKIWKYALTFNIPLIPHFLSTRILQQADRIMIEHYCGLSDAGVYGFSYKISESMLLFNAAFLAGLIPWTYKKLKEEQFEVIHSRAFTTVILIGLLDFLLILIAPETVKILGTEEYYEAIYIIPPIACSCYLMYLFNVFVNVTCYYEQNKLVVAASVFAAVLNIVLNCIFIPRYGYLAAGYTTFASYACLSFMHALMCNYSLKKRNIEVKIYNMYHFFVLSLCLIVLGVGCLVLYNFILLRYCIVVCIMFFIYIKRNFIFALIKRL